VNIGVVQFTHILREANKVADELAGKCFIDKFSGVKYTKKRSNLESWYWGQDKYLVRLLDIYLVVPQRRLLLWEERPFIRE
jgi:hypothetical protein